MKTSCGFRRSTTPRCVTAVRYSRALQRCVTAVRYCRALLPRAFEVRCLRAKCVAAYMYMPARVFVCARVGVCMCMCALGHARVRVRAHVRMRDVYIYSYNPRLALWPQGQHRGRHSMADRLAP